MMRNQLRDAVVVVTGASSGIGRATAHAFARAGATLVLAARREEALKDALQECERLGGCGIVVPTDVGEAEQVDRLCDTAVERYGRLDIWVNNAAVTLFGRLEETPRDAYEKVIQTNLLGCVNGARAAIRQFRDQGHGRLINVSSMVAHAGQPFTSAYVTSKWGIRGLSECLRMELADAPDIHVSTILPASIDTPLFQRAANYVGQSAKAMTPIYPPEKVAAAIVHAARYRMREHFVGNSGRLVAAIRTLAPPLGEKMMERKVNSDHFIQELPIEPGSGNLFDSRGDGAVHGGWIERGYGSPSGGRKGLALVLGLAVALPLALYACHRRA
ncbi:SDR family oxidoreductase [Billgrantia endophytica]|uniref:Short-chain dehydrogenase n=1 Tax=Billgrantia endophytica TaxID=2033802 RepID=A0A2N7TYG4_9GAMM|nr:SDR family oxidoreductase [Halomonas endophytica]PMR73221.1 short-chain dehydrogenase [Halomonas endophytica]